MSTTVPSNNDFDLESIFPQCLEEYNVQSSKINYGINQFNNVCVDIVSKLEIERIYNFSSTCIILSTYLKHIEGKSKEDRIPHCKYFNFKLKLELNGLKPKCEGEEDCYKKITSVTASAGPKIMVPNACNDLIKDLDNDTFSLFKKLEALYYYSGELINKNKQCPPDSNCFRNYKELCETCQNGNNEKLRSFLNKYKDEYLKNVNAAYSCLESPKFIHSSRGTRIRTVLLTLFIITLAIPFIAFILYEYTPCGLYLQPSIKKLKEIWDKKIKKEQKLINPFENAHHELVEKWAQISYSTINYI